MGHYDDIRDEYDARESQQLFERTGLHTYEMNRIQYLKKKIDEYDAFMDIETKREEYKKLKDKMK